jgi:hypothetical protein
VEYVILCDIRHVSPYSCSLVLNDETCLGVVSGKVRVVCMKFCVILICSLISGCEPKCVLLALTKLEKFFSSYLIPRCSVYRKRYGWIP